MTFEGDQGITIYHGKKGMKWGYSNGKKNGKKTAAQIAKLQNQNYMEDKETRDERLNMNPKDREASKRKAASLDRTFGNNPGAATAKDFNNERHYNERQLVVDIDRRLNKMIADAKVKNSKNYTDKEFATLSYNDQKAYAKFVKKTLEAVDFKDSLVKKYTPVPKRTFKNTGKDIEKDIEKAVAKGQKAIDKFIESTKSGGTKTYSLGVHGETPAEKKSREAKEFKEYQKWEAEDNAKRDKKKKK